MTFEPDRTLVQLADLALAFGRVDRTACYHPGSDTPESDTDHTVMLGWIAPALASRLYPWLDANLVASLALVHDMVEVYAGDTFTLRANYDSRAKAEREHHAQQRLTDELTELPWVATMLGMYEAQVRSEARFVRAVDKLLPKLVHLLCHGKGLLDHDVSVDELTAVLVKQQNDIRQYAGEFAELAELQQRFVTRVIELRRTLAE